MFSTHTLVSYPIVSRFGVSKNEAVAITVGGTILTDTIVLILLAIIVSSKQGHLNYSFWLTLFVSLAVFSFIMFKIIPIITRWFFEYFKGEKNSHYVFLLAVVFMSSIFAQISGLDAIIGAFFAGLALNRFVSEDEVLMSQVEFIGNSLFIPFFLISVGMIVNLPLVFTNFRTIMIAIILTLIAIVGKWLAASLTQIIFKYSTTQRNLIFGLSSSHAAATLAIVIVGYRADIVADYILNGTILLIMVTCLVSSFVTEKSASKISNNCI
jgi:Kef-type K+ transport system membrane component KefB